MKSILQMIAVASVATALLCSGQTTSKKTPPPPAKTTEKATKPAAPAAADQCIAMTKDGDRCKRKAAEGSKYCWQHDPKKQGKTTKKA